MNSDCKRPDIERCGVCDACQNRKLGREIMKEAKSELRGCGKMAMAFMAICMGVCFLAGAGAGLVYVGFRFIVDLLGGK